MHSLAPIALATLLAATAPARAQAQNGTQPGAQTQSPTPFTVPTATTHFTDPANLAGERPNPRTGRELPIDGGLGPDGHPANALGLAQLLRKLNTRASLMLIVAHPDDEDGGMLAYYSRGLGARVAVLTLTRGEGGQNQMTGDFEDALGLLRTQELLSADRYMGVDTQMFGTEVDFGFTKTKAEAFQKWNHDRVLYDAVRAVRIFRPLVIAAVFSGAVTDGHGQHQVSGQIAQEVFQAAGDPTVFPELTREGILPWQPLKVYARVPFSRVTAQGLYDYATGQTVPAEFTNYVTGQHFTTEPTADVTINEGATDPLLTYAATNLSDLRYKPANLNEPLSYVQFARIGLGLQRTQIGGIDRVPPPGHVDVSYHLYGSRVCAPNLPNPTPNLCSPNPADSAGKSPTARAIPAQGNALDNESNEPQKAEGAPYNPALANQPSFFNGMDTSILSIADLAPQAFPSDLLSDVSRGIRAATEQFDPKDRSKIGPALAASLKALDQLIAIIEKWNGNPIQKENALHELRIKRVQLDDAIALSLGVEMDATLESAQQSAEPFAFPQPSAQPTSLLPGDAARILIRVKTADTPVTWSNWYIHGSGSQENVDGFGLEIPAHTAHVFQQSISIQAKPFVVTRSYFWRPSAEQPVYDLTVPALRNASQTPPALTVRGYFHYNGTDFTVEAVVNDNLLLPSGAVLHQPVQIVPPVSLTLDRNAQAVPDGTHSLKIDVHAETEDHPQGELRLQMPQNWTIRSPQRPLRAGTESFFASLPAPLQASTLKAEAIISGSSYAEGFRPVGYGNLPRTNFYTPSTLRVVPVDLKLPPPNKRRIAYLPGTGDDVPAALASIGLAPTILKVSDLTPANLAHFDTIILGVRTYNAHPDLHGAPTRALLDFARNGGNVVVQYQTPEFTAADAPYPLTDHNERVIDETAPVTLLANSKRGTEPNPLLTTPNKITSADFNNWIEERGHGFLETWDPRYTALTETHDPGAPAEHILPQSPQRGGLITVQLGRGRWTYCAFALYRQLPEAVPGAFRLFVNLLNP